MRSFLIGLLLGALFLSGPVQAQEFLSPDETAWRPGDIAMANGGCSQPDASEHAFRNGYETVVFRKFLEQDICWFYRTPMPVVLIGRVRHWPEGSQGIEMSVSMWLAKNPVEKLYIRLSDEHGPHKLKKRISI